MNRTAHAITPVVRCYLVRHAIAEVRGPRWPDDRDRPLSARGVDRMKQVVKGLGALGVTFDVILTSPLVRARQTADLLQAGATPRRRPPIVEMPALAPGHNPDRTVRAMLAEARRFTEVALVGHEPDLGLLLAWLLGHDDNDLHDTPFIVRKGSVCRVDVDRRTRAAHLVWFAPPKLMRRVGR